MTLFLAPPPPPGHPRLR